MKRFFPVLPVFISCLCLVLSLTSKGQEVRKFKLIYSQEFYDTTGVDDFVFSDPDKWRVNHDSMGNSFLECMGVGTYEPKVRSPYCIALFNDKVVGDFVLEANLMQTGKEYNHRDMCVFFGFVDSTHFYYVHLASVADPNAHNIFIVNDSARRAIATHTTAGIDWRQNCWHQVRIERNSNTGSILVYFDDMSTPLMQATSRVFPEGRIGFGSFDDSGRIDNIRLWAPRASHPSKKIFKEK